MVKHVIQFLVLIMTMVWIGSCTTSKIPNGHSVTLTELITPVLQSVVTVAAFDTEGKPSAIGSGFFIDRQGTLVTNYHVLEGAYSAEVKTAAGEKFTVSAVVAQNQFTDLIKVRVDIPDRKSRPLDLAQDDAQLADRMVVIGSPLGLEQTISEGIVSAVRIHPQNGKIYQFTAPISPGSSGSPALNLQGDVIGVVSFQSAKGQNLNFAISIKALEMMPDEPGEISLAEWTIKNTANNLGLAASLCRQGAKLSISGRFEEALDYYQRATESNPDDPKAWNGLGSCYVGLNQPDNAIEAFHNSIAASPDSSSGHLILARYYKLLENHQAEILALKRGIKIDPDNLQARFELADAYGKLDQTDAQLASLKEILAMKPNHVPTLHRMGKTVSRIGRYDEALKHLLKASSLAPDNAQIHYDIGVAYHHKKSPEKELRAYTLAIRADPWMAPAHYNMGRLFLHQGNRKLALHQYDILKKIETTLARRLFDQIYPKSIEEVSAPRTTKP